MYHEQAVLEPSVRTLHDYLSAQFDIPCLITIADNTKTDTTLAIATYDGTTWPGVGIEIGDSFTLVATVNLDGTFYWAVTTNDTGTATNEPAPSVEDDSTNVDSTPTPTPTAATEDTGSTALDFASWIGWGISGLVLLILIVWGVLIVIGVRTRGGSSFSGSSLAATCRRRRG